MRDPTFALNPKICILESNPPYAGREGVRSTLRAVNLMSINVRHDSELNSKKFENFYFLTFFDQVERSMSAIWPVKSSNRAKMRT